MVTGGAGFIGSNYIHYMFKKYGDEIRIINVDALTYAGNLENLKDLDKRGNYTFIKADICDRDAISAIFAENDIDRLDNRKLARFHRRVSILAGQAEEKLFCLTLLASLLARGKAFDSMRPGITEQVDAHKHLLRSLERVQDRISELMRLTDSRSRQQTEQRLRVLTIISGIFMPLTFITGLYGMNFPSMPFLENRWGFWLVVCSMLGLGAGLITFFRKRGWFD